MGLLDRIRKAVSASGTGPVGTSPSEAFPASVDLIHEGLSRFARSPAREGGWLTIQVRDAGGREIGIVQHTAGELINLCDRDDIDLRALFVSAGREDLAARCDERDSAMFGIEGATVEEIALAMELVIVSGIAPGDGAVIEARIEA
jgi:hypothetical protein